MRSLTVLLALLGLAGCVTLTQSEGAGSKGSSVGDRALSFDPIVVPVRLEGSTSGYDNLHVLLAAMVNPRKTTLQSLDTAVGIVRRQEPRLRAEVVKLLLRKERVTLASLAALSDEITARSQASLTDTFSRWTGSSDYQVEVALTSLFFTGPNVPVSFRAPRWFED
jgi:hypothetical protein